MNFKRNKFTEWCNDHPVAAVNLAKKLGYELDHEYFAYEVDLDESEGKKS